jgi:hypothetical protein
MTVWKQSWDDGDSRQNIQRCGQKDSHSIRMRVRVEIYMGEGATRSVAGYELF